MAIVVQNTTFISRQALYPFISLKQSQVPCYTERKVTEYRDRIEFLKREYQAFVRKLRHIDPSIGLVPWTERSYETKKRVAPTENGTIVIQLL